MRIAALERYLLLANERFAIRVTSTLKPSEKTPAASTLILKVETAPKLEGGVSIDNRGTKAVGAVQISSNIAVNGLFGRASQTALTYVTAQQLRELQYVSVSHTELLYHEGTTLNFTWTGTESEPGTPPLRTLAYKSSSSDWALKLNHPFLRTRQQNLSGYLKYEARDTAGQSLGQLTLNDKIRSIRLGLNFDNRDATDAVNQLLLEYSFGIRGLGATPYDSQFKSRADGRSDYQKLTVNASRRQPLGYFSSLLSDFSMSMVMMGQYSGSGLLSSEKCGIGGRQIGRAYDPSEILGDSCVAGSLELAYNTPLEIPFLKYSQLYAFYDGGATFDHTPTRATDTVNKSLMSTGGGLRFGLSDYVSTSIEGTQPLTRVIANKGNRDPRIFATLSVRF
jgi:hemolysin activation/secretion protein